MLLGDIAETVTLLGAFGGSEKRGKKRVEHDLAYTSNDQVSYVYIEFQLSHY